MIQTLKECKAKNLNGVTELSKDQLEELLQQIEDLEQKVTISNDLATLLTRYGYESPNLPFKAYNPCETCGSNPKNGGSGICWCTLGSRSNFY